MTDLNLPGPDRSDALSFLELFSPPTPSKPDSPLVPQRATATAFSTADMEDLIPSLPPLGCGELWEARDSHCRVRGPGTGSAPSF